MARILIVSKTRMKHGVCVGGINEDNLELVRLHDAMGGNLGFDVPFEIGDRWEVDIQTAWNVRSKPHVEDKQTIPIELINKISISEIADFIRSKKFNERFVKGSIFNTFQNCLKLEGVAIYICKNNIPQFSTQFWEIDSDLTYYDQWDKDYYLYNGIKLKYVGFQPIVERIPKGTIVRLSLANWWKKDEVCEERCYLQLAGWYF